jgi:DNA mismatch repair protein MSH6
VEQTETPEMLAERKKKFKGKGSPKVVNREVCSVLTVGTRTFCYLDDTASILEENVENSMVGPLLAIREVARAPSSSDNMVTDSDDDETVAQIVCEYGITLVDAMRGAITIGQFADDVLRSRMNTLLRTFAPSEVSLPAESIARSGASTLT